MVPIEMLRAVSNIIRTVTGPSNNEIDQLGYNGLMRACAKRKRKKALKLVEKCDINLVGNDGSTALIMACSGNIPNVALAILAKKPENVNAVDNHQATALMYACAAGLEDVVTVLLTMDCNFHHTGGGTAAITLASESGMGDVVMNMLDYESWYEKATTHWRTKVMVLAASSGLTSVVNEMIARGSDPSVADSYNGMTPLCAACRGRRTKTALAILKFSCAPGEVSRAGYTPLMYASRNGMNRVVKELVKLDCNPNQQDHTIGLNAAEMARMGNFHSIVKILMPLVPVRESWKWKVSDYNTAQMARAGII